jgi:hypothetical protein
MLAPTHLVDTAMNIRAASCLALVLAAPIALAQDEAPIPEKIPSPPSEETEPTVSIRTGENGDVVEEYRQGGVLYMVRVKPAGGGPEYTLMDSNGDGRLDKDDAEDAGGVSPVYFTIYEWD